MKKTPLANMLATR